MNELHVYPGLYLRIKPAFDSQYAHFKMQEEALYQHIEHAVMEYLQELIITNKLLEGRRHVLAIEIPYRSYIDDSENKLMIKVQVNDNDVSIIGADRELMTILHYHHLENVTKQIKTG